MPSIWPNAAAIGSLYALTVSGKTPLSKTNFKVAASLKAFIASAFSLVALASALPLASMPAASAKAACLLASASNLTASAAFSLAIL